MTAATATRDIFDLAGATFGTETDEMAERFAAVATPVPVIEVRCLGCGRVLHSAESRARGRGRACYRRAMDAAATLGPEFSDRQVEAAIEAIEDGAVVPSGIAGVWLVVGSRGDKVYATTVSTCECEHFAKRGRACHHMASVSLVA